MLLGLAFEVKLAEALLPVCAAAALWWFAGPRARRPRAFGLGLLGGAFLASALAWLVVVTVVPLHPRPWALGASDGSPWRAALVYNGTARLLGGGGNAPSAAAPGARAGSEAAAARRATARAPSAAARGAGAGSEAAAARGAPARRGAAAARRAATPREVAAVARRAGEHAAALGRRPAPPGPLRLLSAQAHLGRWIGIEAVAALAALAVALALGGARGLGRVGRGGLLALVLWLVAGLVLCSGMLRPASALPGLRGSRRGGLPGRGRRARRPRAPTARADRGRRGAVRGPGSAARHRAWPPWATASRCRGAPGRCRRRASPPCRTSCSAHTAGAADEVAVSAPAKAGPLIAHDGRPVLILSDGQGNQLVSPATLAHAVAGGRVRYALLGDACTAHSGNERTGCLPVVRWARAHGVDVSRAAGQPHARRALRPHPPGGRGGRLRKNCHVRHVAAKGAGGGWVRGPPGQPWAWPSRRTCSTRVPAMQWRQAISVTPARASADRHCPGSRRCAATATATASRRR